MDIKSIDVSIVIVNYKTPDLLKDCVQSIIQNTLGVNYEIIIVDNNSEDESEQLIKSVYPEVKWLNTGYNAGFARANNLGILNAEGNYILLLNSDTIVNENTLIKTISEYKNLEESHVKVGFLGCLLMDLNGNIQFNSRTKFMNIQKLFLAHPFVILFYRLFRIKEENKEESYRKNLELHKTFHETKWLGGTYLFFNKRLIKEKNNLLDEDFFMYGEDTEWSLRIGRKGYKHFFTPNASVIHAEGGRFKIKAPKWIQIALSEWLFLLKGYGKIVFFIVALVNLTGIKLDNYFTRRQLRKNTSGVNEQLIEQYNLRRQIELVMKRNFFKVLFKYKKKPSSSPNYLKNI
jgi:GT2 family glycosyltransferase